jgi:hypothetical protein
LKRPYLQIPHQGIAMETLLGPGDGSGEREWREDLSSLMIAFGSKRKSERSQNPRGTQICGREVT